MRLLQSLLPENTAFRLRTADACAHLYKRQQLLATVAAAAKDALTSGVTAAPANSSAAKKETRHLSEFSAALGQLAELEVDSPGSALGLLAEGLAAAQTQLAARRQQQQALLEKLAASELAAAALGEPAGGASASAGASALLLANDSTSQAAGGSKISTSSKAATLLSDASLSEAVALEVTEHEAAAQLDRALKAIEGGKAKAKGFVLQAMKNRLKVSIRSLEAADRVLSGRRRQEVDFGAALVRTFDAQLEYHRQSLEVRKAKSEKIILQLFFFVFSLAFFPS